VIMALEREILIRRRCYKDNENVMANTVDIAVQLHLSIFNVMLVWNDFLNNIC